MDNDKLLKLVDAGFTKEEIAKILDVPDKESEDPKQGMEQSEGDKEHEGAIESGNNDKTIAELTATIKELKETVKAMQESNAKGANTDKPDSSNKIMETMRSFTESL